MSWPPRGVDPTLNEKLRRVLANSERAQEPILDIFRDLNGLCDEKTARVSKGLPLADLLQKTEELVSTAKLAHQPEYAASASMLRAEILLELKRPEDALAYLNAARAEWLGPSGADESSDSAPRRAMDVQFLEWIAEAHLALNDIQSVSRVCGEAIDRIETDRYKINSPYLQSAYLKLRVGPYKRGVAAAFKLRDYETMLARAELSKARSVLRIHHGKDALPRDPQQEQQFKELSNEIRAMDPSGEAGANLVKSPNEVLENLLEKRRQLWDLLAIARFRSADGGMPAIPLFSLKAVQNAIEPDEAILYYYWLQPKDLLVVAIDSERLAVDRVTLENHEESAALAQMIDAIRVFSNPQIPPNELELEKANFERNVQLYSPLLLPEPVWPLFEGKRRLIVSPHHRLHLLPFHALQWKSGFLIESFAVSYVPNLCTLLAPTRPAQPPKILLSGVGEFASYLKQPVLNEVEEELDGVADAYRREEIETEVLPGEQLTRRELLSWSENGRLSSFSCIHLATHGTSVLGEDASNTPMESKMMLFDAALDGLEISTLNLKTDLVVLSACHSGQRAISGRGMGELPGDDVFGIQAAFGIAGVQTVLGCLWSADDRVSKAVMISFHRHRSKHQPVEVALQAAIRQQLRQPTNRACFFWAPFFLTALGGRISS